MNAKILVNQDISALESLLLKDGKLQPVHYEDLKPFSQNQISIFCVKHACYQIITHELIAFIKEQIGSRKAIEIGAGNGCLGRALGITMTDNFQQQRPEIKAYYDALKQPVITYGNDIMEMDANTAVNFFKPEVVIGSWITEKWKPGRDGNVLGVDETNFKGKIQDYILVGNYNTHGHKEIISLFPHKAFRFDWLVSRSMERIKNVLYIFDCK